MRKITLFTMLLLTFNFGFGQIITFEFNGLAGNEASATSNSNDTNLGTSTITRGAGLTASNNGNRFNATSWALTDIATAVSGDDYMEFTITPNSGFQFNVTTIDINFQRSGTGPSGISLRSSIDSYATDIDGEKAIIDNTSTQTFSFNVSQSNSTSAVTYRFYGWAEATGGSGGFEGTGNDIEVNGSTSSAGCSHTITSFTPTEGPEGTEVTITGTNYTGSSTVDFDGTSASVVFVNATTLIATVPSGATTGTIDVTESSCTESSATDFTSTSITGSCYFSDLIMSEIYDAGPGGGALGYVEVYNGTGATIDLSDYRIDRYLNIADVTSSSSYSFPTLNILHGETLFGRITTDPNVTTPDFEFGGGGFNDDDKFELVHIPSATIIDDWHEDMIGAPGYSYRRNTDISGPNPTYDSSEWTAVAPEVITDLGTYSAISIIPTISTQPTSINDCASDISFTVAATSSGALSYQWKYNDGIASDWSDVSAAAFAPGAVSGETSNTLSINGLDVSDYQFYCEITDSGCSIASSTVQVDVDFATWASGAWVDAVTPTLSTCVILSDDYDTSSGNFSGCSLNINSGITLTVSNGTFVEIENNALGGGNLIVETQGNFVQNDDAGTFTFSGSTQVNKTTPSKNEWYYYTYWSSPVVGETVEDVFPNTPTNRRYLFNASNYEDTDGDDIDDDNNDWNIASGVMTPGVGYIAMSDPSGTYPTTDNASFIGTFNTGDITTGIVFNAANVGESWNLIGNPYPSAIDFDAFQAANSGLIDGVAYFWSHSLPPNSSNPGNQVQNFNQSDYAVYTVGSGGSSGSSGATPTQYVPSGQSFFVSGLANGTATFTNATRMADGTSNDLFFKNSNSKKSNTEADKLWINLTSDNGVFNQTLIAYVDGATNQDDGLYYDAPKRRTTDFITLLYTSIENSNEKFAVQGKAANSINENEIIKLGFATNIEVATIYKLSIANLQGDFLNNNAVYLKDNVLNELHDLTDSDYTFTSEVGEFNNRFEIVFNANALSTDDAIINADKLSIIHLNNSNVRFSTNSDLNIKTIDIFDLLGRQLYHLKGHTNTETFKLSNLNEAIYIAKVELSNGVIVRRKSIKK